MRPLKGTEQYYRAIRQRLGSNLGTGSGTGTVVVPSEIEVRESDGSPSGKVGTIEMDVASATGGFTVAITDTLASIGLQAIHLLLDGTRAMQAALNMGTHAINSVLNIAFNGGVGDARITGVRRITMTGDDDDSEARIDALDRVQFNETPSQAVLDRVGRVEFQSDVLPSSHYTLNEGVASWSSLEGTMVVTVSSGSQLVAGHVGSTAVLYPPSGIDSILVAHIASGLLMYEPAVSIDINEQDVTGGTVYPSAALYASAVGQVIGAAISSGETLYSPTVALA